MFSEGNILYIDPFVFKNGNPSKPKYFIVLKNSGGDLIVASLPTSKDHVPRFLEKQHGCIAGDDYSFNCYFFDPKISVTNNGFSFPRSTYVYGEQVDLYTFDYIDSFIKDTPSNISVQGQLTEFEYASIVECIKNAGSTKRKIKRIL